MTPLFFTRPAGLPAIILAGLLTGCAGPQGHKTESLRLRAAALLTEAENPAVNHVRPPGREAGKDEKTAGTAPILPPIEPGSSPVIKTKPPFSDRTETSIAFEETGKSFTSEYEQPVKCAQRAEQEALMKAMRKAGVDVIYGFADALAQAGDRSREFISRYFLTWSRGIARWDRVGEPRKSIEAGGVACEITIKGEIAQKGGPDPAYNILLDGGGLDKTIYQEGEDVAVSFRITRDSYLYIFSVDEENKTWLVFPNRYLKENRIAAGAGFHYPPAGSGLQMKAALPSGRTDAMEVLHIIGVKNNRLLDLEETKEFKLNDYFLLDFGDFSKLAERLGKLDRSEWTMAVLPYELRK
ncbi:MAG: DUF4384 domain-containing protein [Elusimicrobia bacterium]|nr:DUF4384 domain-containing protein [Elusimicrobiota bacterium]